MLQEQSKDINPQPLPCGMTRLMAVDIWVVLEGIPEKLILRGLILLVLYPLIRVITSAIQH
jgi:hypothetical protein